MRTNGVETLGAPGQDVHDLGRAGVEVGHVQAAGHKREERLRQALAPQHARLVVYCYLRVRRAWHLVMDSSSRCKVCKTDSMD